MSAVSPPSTSEQPDAGRTDLAETGQDELDYTSHPAVEETPWLRLDIRVVFVDLAMFVISFLPTFLVWVVFDVDFDSGSFGIWPALVATSIGVLNAIVDLLRWLKTRYRVTDERIEQRIGWLTKKYRSVPRDRIRSVDFTARPRHRIAGLRVVGVSSGEAKQAFKLDALSVEAATALRLELQRQYRSRPTSQEDRVPVVPTTEDEPKAAEAAPAGEPREETLIASVKWWWFFYNVVNIWAFLVAALLLWGLFWVLQIVNIDLRDVVGRIVDWDAVGPVWSAVIIVGGTFVIGMAGLAWGFVKENWKLQLLRAKTESGSALVTRTGLFDTREVYRDDSRLRGIHLSEPLFWRWMKLTETQVISTGLSAWSGGESGATILPRVPLREAKRVAALVLNDDVQPLEAPLRRHPDSGLVRRLWWAVTGPGLLAVFTFWLGRTGALPDWVWEIFAWLVPVSIVLAVVAQRTLGHTLAGDYLVMRAGWNRRTTNALHRRAVIGFMMGETLVQRALGLRTIEVSTAAGEKAYQVRDIGTAQAVAFLHEALPHVVDDFLEFAHQPSRDKRGK
ncbi:PH domain-containing protein [Micromonospora sp. NPDC047793]|uniref:PH domain-containing protein n=1 Tax=Micromonospora sp. NPDC047793 TaxID=3154342 RepID=UPI0033CCFA0C